VYKKSISLAFKQLFLILMNVKR